MTKSPFRKGRMGTSSGGGSGLFIGVKPDESITIVPIVTINEITSADMHEYWDIRPAIFHPCIGKGCPGCAVGNDPREKGYVPVLQKGESEVKIYPFTTSIYRQLEEIDDALRDGDDDHPGFKGAAIKVSRTGSGFKGTRYSVIPIGKTVDVSKAEVPDFVDKLGPIDPEKIWELLEANGFNRSETVEGDTEDSDEEDWGEI